MNDRRPIVCGSFELLEPVGQGGVATVWRGRHRKREIPVAVKVLTEGRALDRGVREAFRSEVRAHAGLDHPGVATVFEYGRISTDAQVASEGALTAGSPYCALEYAPAGSLREQADIDNWPLLQSLLLEILDALSYAHARGVIHRDLKPENVLYFPGASSGRFKLTDFGIAHAIGGEVGVDTDNLDDAGAGTPQYMPPEQLQGEWRVFGPWTDLYALGCMAYEVVDGDVPFDDENLMEVATQQLTERPPPIDPEFPVPRGFRAWVRCLLAKDLRDRFRRAADAAWMLSQMPSGADERRAAPEREAVAGAAGGGERPKAEFTGRRSSTRRMWSLSHDTAEEFDAALERGTKLQFEPAEPQLTTLATQAALEPNVDGVATGESAPDRGPLETAFQSGPPPPLPENWAEELEEHPSTAEVDAGLELFGIRELPFVGRRDERDRVWEILEEVFDGGGPRIVEITGPAGAGKTRLARWAGRRVHEVGAAHIFWAPHSRRGGPTEGLPAMLESEFGIWGLDRERAYRRISSEVQARYDRLQSSVREPEDEARALTQIIAPTSGSVPDEDGPEYHFSNPEERYDALARFLNELSRERPVFVVLDDAQWGCDGLEFVEHVLEEWEDLPVFFALTVGEASGREPDSLRASEVLEELRETDAHTEIELGPLESAEQAELCHRLLPMEMETAQELIETTDGMPLSMIERLSSWIDRGRLGIGRAGFELRGEPAEVPGDVVDVLDRRLEAAIEYLQRRADSRIERALELAAALGPHVDLEEWRAVCERDGAEARELVHETLIRMGLARSRTQGWSFEHDRFVERLARRAREHGRWVEHHYRCAEVLEELYDADHPRMQSRVAAHYREAAAPERALEPMITYARHLFDCGAHRRLRHVLDRRASLLDRLEGRTDAELENLRLRARHAAAVATPERAAEWARRLRERAESAGDTDAVGWARWLEARAAREQGRLEAADRSLESAVHRLSESGSTVGLGFVARERGRLLERRGELSDAVDSYERAADRFSDTGERTRAARARAEAAAVEAREADDPEEAASTLRELRADAREVGDDSLRALVWRRLGAVRRQLGDDEGAEAALRHAEVFEGGKVEG